MSAPGGSDVMKKAVLVATVVSAYLMYKRGESMMSIEGKTVINPVESLVTEVKNAV